MAKPDFDSIKHLNPYHVEYWEARELMPLLGYGNKWQNFVDVIKKAMISCETTGNIVTYQLVKLPDGKQRLIHVSSLSYRVYSNAVRSVKPELLCRQPSQGEEDLLPPFAMILPKKLQLSRWCLAMGAGVQRHHEREDRMDTTGVHAAFVAAGLSRLLKDLDDIARPSIRLLTTPVDESTLTLGTSKIGGVPDLPSGVPWPQCHGLPQSFITQIRLADIGHYDAENVLPHAGMLWFFYDAQQQTFGENPTDTGCWCVLFRENLTGLQRRTPPAPLPTASQFKACSIRCATEITLSQYPKLDVPHFDWTDEEQKNYETLLSTFPNPEDHAAIHHRLLGNPETLQDDMRLQCQLVSHGITDESDPRAAEVAKGAMDWLLLLQIDSDEHAGMRWGNAGMLYYWVKRDDLKAQRFDDTWLVLQSE